MTGKLTVGHGGQSYQDSHAESGQKERQNQMVQEKAQQMTPETQFMATAISLATENVVSGRGGPFGAVVVRGGEVVATGINQVTTSNDPTAHAEVVAIRNACKVLGSFKLDDCVVYTSCEPCPMCLAAIYWARCKAVFYGNSAADAAKIGFDDQLFYEELKRSNADRELPMMQWMSQEAWESFSAWEKSPMRIEY